jgi:D-aminopeptidase
VGALVAANPIGSVIRPNSRHFWAAPFEVDAEFGGLGAEPDALNFETALPLKSDASNTTIAIVATDALLSKAQAKRVAVAAQDGIGRAVVPSHTPFDGDLVFAAATGKVALTDEPRQVMEIGNAGAMALSRAIARAIYSASPARDDVVGCWSDLA